MNFSDMRIQKIIAREKIRVNQKYLDNSYVYGEGISYFTEYVPQLSHPYP